MNIKSPTEDKHLSMNQQYQAASSYYSNTSEFDSYTYQERDELIDDFSEG